VNGGNSSAFCKILWEVEKKMPRKVFIIGMVLLVSVFFSGCFSGENDKELIQKVIEGYFAALNEPNQEKAQKYVLPESAADEWLTEFFAEKVPLAQQQNVRYEYTFTIQEITVDATGREAQVFLTYTFRAIGYEGLSAPEFEGTFHLTRQGKQWFLTAAPLAS
jgi:hypothetical protein